MGVCHPSHKTSTICCLGSDSLSQNAVAGKWYVLWLVAGDSSRPLNNAPGGRALK